MKTLIINGGIGARACSFGNHRFAADSLQQRSFAVTQN